MLQAWYCDETKRLRVAATAFSEWCQSRSVSPRPMLGALKRRGIRIKETRACLGAHVSIYPSARVRVYELEGDALKELGYGAPQEEKEEA